jgi:hypothetical protein
MPKPDPESRLANVAFRLLAENAWNEMTLASVARAAKLSWDDVLKTAPSRTALVGLMVRRTGAETARRYRPDRASQSARDRLFDVLMTWFEAQSSRKAAIRSLYDGLRKEPLTLLSLRGEIAAGAEWLLALAEVDCGAAAPVRAACIGGIMAHALPAWFEDDAELGKTMAQVDRDLRRVERFLWPTPKPQARRKAKPR